MKTRKTTPNPTYRNARENKIIQTKQQIWQKLQEKKERDENSNLKASASIQKTTKRLPTNDQSKTKKSDEKTTHGTFTESVSSCGPISKIRVNACRMLSVQTNEALEVMIMMKAMNAR